MILTEIQSYIAQHEKVSVTDLANHFRISPQALHPMLEKLQRKGRIRQLSLPQCGGCSSCSRETLELYESLQE